MSAHQLDSKIFMIRGQHGNFRNQNNNVLLHQIDLEISMIGADIVANLEIKSTTGQFIK